MARLSLAVWAALASLVASVSYDGEVSDLGDGIGAAAERQQAYRTYFEQTLKAAGVQAHTAAKVYERHVHQDLGEAKAKAVQFTGQEPKNPLAAADSPLESLDDLKSTAMTTAIKVLELENQKSKLVAENTMNAESVPTYEIAKALMTPAEYEAWHKNGPAAEHHTEKNEKYLEKERKRLRDMMQKDFAGNYRTQLEAKMNKMMNKLEQKTLLNAGKKEESKGEDEAEESKEESSTDQKAAKVKKLKAAVKADTALLKKAEKSPA